MQTETEAKFIERALQLFHEMKKGIDFKERNRQFMELFKTVEKTPLQKMITLWDMRDAIMNIAPLYLSKPIEEVNDEEFIEQFRSHVLSTKTYDFYVPIYCLYEFPKNMKLGVSTVMDFQDLPTETKRYFTMFWEHRFTIDTEYHRTKDEYINLKKKSTFIHLVVEANGSYKANEKSRRLAEDALHIIRFLYQINFNIVDMRYEVRGSKNAGGQEGIAGLPFIGGASYSKRFEERIAILTDIFTKSNPNEIERKIRNAVRIFGIQASVNNEQVRFVLLVTCLESLLMTKGDRDYILWRLAEKTAFILGRNKRAIDNFVKEAYDKRSAFVHGSSEEDELATENDIYETQGIVVNLVWKLVFGFLKSGYTQVQKKKGVKSMNEYIEETKYGKE